MATWLLAINNSAVCLGQTGAAVVGGALATSAYLLLAPQAGACVEVVAGATLAAGTSATK